MSGVIESIKNGASAVANAAKAGAEKVANTGAGWIESPETKRAREVLKIAAQIAQVVAVIFTVASAASVFFALAHASVAGVILGTLSMVIFTDLFLFSRGVENIASKPKNFCLIFDEPETRVLNLIKEAAKPTLIFKPLFNTVMQIAPPAA